MLNLNDAVKRGYRELHGNVDGGNTAITADFPQ